MMKTSLCGQSLAITPPSSKALLRIICAYSVSLTPRMAFLHVCSAAPVLLTSIFILPCGITIVFNFVFISFFLNIVSALDNTNRQP